jgi:hypothetical protein
MDNLPLEINGLIFSYLDAKEMLNYMKSSQECCVEIKKISKYITLENLEIRETNDISYYTNMKIHQVSLYGDDIRDKDLKLISESIKRIEYMHLSSCDQISDDGLKYLKNIHTIDISRCSKITDNGLMHLQNINSIVIHENQNITNAGLKHLSNMYHVELLSCDKITDDGLEYLENVHTVSIMDSENITDNGIKKLKNVKYLQLINLCVLTDDCFEYLGNLEVLDFSDNSFITDNALEYLSNIKFLIVENCDNITIKGINKLLEKKPGLIWSIDDVGNNKSFESKFSDI